MIRTIARVAAMGAILSLIACSAEARPHRVPSSVMLPTILPGEYVSVEPLSADRPIAVGDVVVNLEDTPASGPTGVVRRVLALPGQRIAFRDGVAILDGVPVERVAVGVADLSEFSSARGVRYRETMAGRTFETLNIDGPGDVRLRDMAEITIPPGHFFFAGDYRDNSLDSRMLGPGPLSAVQGRVTSIVQSQDSNRIGLLVE
jgi:signal peptidase I